MREADAFDSFVLGHLGPVAARSFRRSFRFSKAPRAHLFQQQHQHQLEEL